MGFMEAYKRLDRLCADVMKNGRGISAYIEEMSRIPGAVWRVPGWENDLKKLKNYRWIRNQIAHETDCDERNMCSEEDVVWLDNFRRRIMEGQDPLALYRKATQPAPKPTTSKTPVRNTSAAPSKISDKPAKEKQSWTLIILKLILVGLLVMFVGAIVVLIRSL